MAAEISAPVLRESKRSCRLIVFVTFSNIVPCLSFNDGGDCGNTHAILSANATTFLHRLHTDMRICWKPSWAVTGVRAAFTLEVTETMVFRNLATAACRPAASSRYAGVRGEAQLSLVNGWSELLEGMTGAHTAPFMNQRYQNTATAQAP